MQPLAQLHILQRRRSSSNMSIPEDEALDPIPGPMTPDMSTPPCTAMNFTFNPRARLLRRTSSTSTLGSISDVDDAEEEEWTEDDVDKLRRIYDRCVDEAALETPFSGVPPSQLLHVMARACQRVYRDKWTHSVTATRLKTLEIGRELHGKNRSDVTQATPRPNDVEETPKRRRLSRNSSMDFGTHTRDLSCAARLSNRLHQHSENEPSIFFSARMRSETSSSASKAIPTASFGVARLARSMTFTSINDNGSSHTSLHHAPPPISTSHTPTRSTFGHPLSAGCVAMPPLRPGLYAMPSYGGSTESMRLNDEVNASLYGSSIASSVSSGFTMRSDWTAPSSKPSLEQLETRSSHGWLGTPKAKKRSHTLSAASTTSSAEGTPTSLPEFSWSGSSTASQRAMDAEAALASPTPSPYHSTDSLTAAYGSDDERDGGYPRDYLQEGFSKAGRSIRAMPSWSIIDPRKHRRTCSNGSDNGLALESPFDGDFLK